MNVGLYRGVAAVEASQRRLEAISSNLANVSTAGFKRQDAVHHGFQMGSAALGFEGVATTTRIDFTQGALERTGNPLDLALAGDGFFEVESPTGPLYTRAGAFQIDAQGVLTTSLGMPVAWEGARGTIDPAGGPVMVDLEGGVSQDGESRGRLRVVDFDARELLEPLAGGLFRASRGLAAGPSAAEVHQGALEGANVSAVDELVRLISVQRDFEAATNVMRMIDQTYERLNSLR